MNGKILSVMEFDKILHRIESFASTSMGKSRAAALLPSPDLEEVKRRLKETDEAAQVVRLKGGASFAGIRDIGPSVKRAGIGGMLNAQELLDTANTIGGGRKLKRFLHKLHEHSPIALLSAMSEGIAELTELEQSIRSCIDEQGEVMDSASPELQRIRSELRSGENRARERLEQMVRSHSVQKMLQEQLITMRNDRYVIPVKQEYRAQFGGIIHDQSASGATLFIEPESVVVLNNKLRELKLKEEREIEKILFALTAETAEAGEELLGNIGVLGELDFIFAKAGYAHSIRATLPMMNDRGFFKLKKARHPLISGKAVPTDVEMGNGFSAMIITGPNTGGKTVTLKTIGLLHLMAMSGLFAPAEDGTQMCVFDGIFADIGDEQSIEQNLSTFSSHMTNMIGILKEITPKSLVLLDELGAGTDPAEGSALAIAILEYVHKMECRLVATTHYSELKAYAYERKGIINASMEFDIQSLIPTYRLLVGIPGRSNAFAIAERLGLPREIIDLARGQVHEDDLRVDNMIASLEENRLSAESERSTAEQLRREVEKLRQSLDAEKRRFDEQREQMRERAGKQAEEIVAKARREAEEIIADLRRMAMDEAASIKEHKLIEARKRLEEALPAPKERRKSGKSANHLKPGDDVLIPHLGQKGFVTEIAGNELVVQLGIMKMKVKRSEIEPLDAPAKQKQVQQVTTVKRTRDGDVKSELDLRGSNLEDSLHEVDRFLDEAFLANLNQVYIIHGKGTGVLRSGVQDYLRRNKHVKNYRLGNFGEGGTGVTVVELG